MAGAAGGRAMRRRAKSCLPSASPATRLTAGKGTGPYLNGVVGRGIASRLPVLAIPKRMAAKSAEMLDPGKPVRLPGKPQRPMPPKTKMTFARAFPRPKSGPMSSPIWQRCNKPPIARKIQRGRVRVWCGLFRCVHRQSRLCARCIPTLALMAKLRTSISNEVAQS